ncbi:MAG: helix-turn-helix domain-containing protein [Enterococcus sp.]
MHDGELIRNLRMGRKLTQSQLAMGICSKTALVGMENGTVKKISFLTLKLFLNRLNITLAEYEWLRNLLDEPEKERLQRQAMSRVFEAEFDVYKAIANNRKKYRQTDDIYYLVLNIGILWQVGHHQFKEMQLDMLRYESDCIEEYFNELREFGHFELEIIAKWPFLFSDTYIESNYARIKKKMNQFGGLRSYERYVFIFQLNLIRQYIAKRRYKKARAINQDMHSLLREQDTKAVIYEQLQTKFYHYLLKFALREQVKEENLIELFSVIDYTLGHNQKNQMEQEYQTLKMYIQNK